MRDIRHRLSAVALAACAMGWSGQAGAYYERGSERVTHTAYTLDSWELSLGLWRAELGTLKQITIGTYVPTWFTYPILETTVPTGFVKARDWFDADLAASVRAGFVLFAADTLSQKLLDDANVQGGMVVFPLAAATSWRIDDRFTQSLELGYVLAAAGGSREGEARLEGGVVTENVTDRPDGVATESRRRVDAAGPLSGLPR